MYTARLPIPHYLCPERTRGHCPKHHERHKCEEQTHSGRIHTQRMLGNTIRTCQWEPALMGRKPTTKQEERLPASKGHDEFQETTGYGQISFPKVYYVLCPQVPGNSTERFNQAARVDHTGRGQNGCRSPAHAKSGTELMFAKTDQTMRSFGLGDTRSGSMRQTGTSVGATNISRATSLVLVVITFRRY